MLKFIKNILSPDAAMPEWIAAEHTVVKDSKTKSELDTIGYSIPKRLDSNTLEQLRALYAKTHNFKLEDGGMFYSVYSHDLEYRKKVHDSIAEIMKEIYDDLFEDYKVVLNSFIVKVNGPDSEFGLHQDSTGLDETKYSPISVWIPLQDTTVENGCLSVVPKSFKWFSPYRGISFAEPFRDIQDEVKHYLQPIDLKAGDILLFDNRLVHYSPPNNSDRERVVVMSGVFPSKAEFISCWKGPEDKSNEIEIFSQKDDYLLTFKNFFHDCTCRPEVGEFKGKVQWPIPSMTKEDFVKLAEKEKVPRVSHPILIQSFKSNIVAEPI